MVVKDTFGKIQNRITVMFFLLSIIILMSSNIVFAAPTLSPASLPSGSAGTPYSRTLTASGGTEPYSYSISAGALPTGLGLNSATGVISGTPTQTGSFTFTVTVTDSEVSTASRSYTVSIGSPNFTLSPPTLTASIGQPYSQPFVAGGGTAPYTYARIAGTLPTGLTLDSSGLLSGTPSATGTFNFTMRAQDCTTGPGSPFAVVSNYNFIVANPTIAVSPATLPGPTAGQAYSQTISAAGGTAPYTYAITGGALPAGLSLNSATGVLSGTPTATGSYNFTVTATDSSDAGFGGGFSGSRAYTITAGAPSIIINNATLPTPILNQAYSQTISAVGGTAPYTYSISAGALPAGLTLNSTTGVLSGTPSTTGTFSFTIAAGDSTTGPGAPFSGSNTYTLTPIPSVSLNSDVVSFSETGGTATITASLSGLSPVDVSVNLGFSGTATEGSDYTSSASTITVLAGNSTGSAIINAVADTAVEGSETIIIDITGVTNGIENGIQQISIGIMDDDSSSSGSRRSSKPAAPPAPVLPSAGTTPLELRFVIGTQNFFMTSGSETPIQNPMDSAPVILHNRMMLPIRFVAEPLGGSVNWYPLEKKVTIVRGITTIELWIGENTAKINGVSTPIDSNPEVKPVLTPSGRAILPVRFIAEALGVNVVWEPNTRQVILTSK